MKWIDLRAVVTTVVSAAFLAVLAFLVSRIKSLDPEIVIAVSVGLVVGVGFAVIDRRLRTVERKLKTEEQMRDEETRLRYIETHLALVRARLILNQSVEISPLKEDLEQIVAAALVAGFRVTPVKSKWSSGEADIEFHPPPGSTSPGILKIDPLHRDSVDSAAQWVRNHGAPVGMISSDP